MWSFVGNGERRIRPEPHHRLASTNWRIAGTVDANDDGADEILWQHQDGMVATWEMDGGEFVAAHTFGVVSNDWRIQGTGQFDFA